MESPVSKAAAITGGVVNELQRRCQCNFKTDRISDAAFRCYPESPQAVTYRATLHATQHTPTTALLRLLQEWVSTGASVVYEAQLLSADESCSISITSLSDPECESPNVPTGTLSSSSQSFFSSVGGIVGVAVAAVVAVVIVVVLVFVVVLVLKCRKRTAKMEGNTKIKQSPKE